MRVAIVYHFFAHYREPIIRELISDADIDYYFIGSKTSSLVYSSLKLYEFSQTDRFIGVRNVWIQKYFLWQRGLTSILNKYKFDAVIFLGDWKFLSTWKALFFLKMNKTPAFFWGHGLLNNKLNLNNFLKIFFLSRFSHGGFLYSHGAKEIMNRKGYKKPLYVIYNSLDFEGQRRVTSSLTELGLGVLPTPYMIFSGRLIPQRNLELLVDAIEIISRKGVKLSVLIVGEGPHKSCLMDYAKHKNVATNIIFKGAVYNELELANYFVNSLACVYPGPIGLAIVHSLAYGVPVITNDDYINQKPEIEALEPEVNGFLFHNNNVYSLVEKMEHVLTLTAKERENIRLNAIRTVSERYNPKVQAQILRQVMLEI